MDLTLGFHLGMEQLGCMPAQMDLPVPLEFSFAMLIGKLLKLWIP
jgi:hypothetical protein